jgi:hypothetical protein
VQQPVAPETREGADGANAIRQALQPAGRPPPAQTPRVSAQAVRRAVDEGKSSGNSQRAIESYIVAASRKRPRLSSATPSSSAAGWVDDGRVVEFESAPTSRRYRRAPSTASAPRPASRSAITRNQRASVRAVPEEKFASCSRRAAAESARPRRIRFWPSSSLANGAVGDRLSKTFAAAMDSSYRSMRASSSAV